MDKDTMTIEREWKTFKAKCAAPDSTADQLESMRATFFAGAFCIMMMQAEMSADEDLTDDDAAEIINGWHEETHAVFKQGPSDAFEDAKERVVKSATKLLN